MAGQPNKLAQEGMDAYLHTRGKEICAAYKKQLRKAGGRNPKNAEGDARAWLYLRLRMPTMVARWMEEV